MDVEIDVSAIDGLGSLTVVDIRTEQEVLAELLPCDHVHIPMDRLLNHPQLLQADQTYVLVCAAGMRTLFAAAELRKIGYESVYSLKGGLPSLKR
ncbi:MAG: rhodanese-like domain-containing protein [Kiritimatiellales bacterium]|nr:rhodanese-like domain-containing protein [Kiritimatiellales bacterium]